MQMLLEFPDGAPKILTELKVKDALSGAEYAVDLSEAATITFTLHTPDGAFTYTIDNARKTLTTESDTPFLA